MHDVTTDKQKREHVNPLEGSVILLNAPPGAGKDTVADRIIELCPGVHKGQFKDHLYVVTAVLFNVKIKEFIKVATDRDLKEKPSPALGGLSPRQALIKVSEHMIKPAMGKGYFGNIESNKLIARLPKGVVYSDCGFIEEVMPMVRQAGAENVYIIKFTRKGYDKFNNDSRNWLPDIEGAKVLMTANNSTVDSIAQTIIKFVSRGGAPLH